MDAKLAGLIRRLNEARRRRAILLGFAHAPIDMTHALLAAQVGAGPGARGEARAGIGI